MRIERPVEDEEEKSVPALESPDPALEILSSARKKFETEKKRGLNNIKEIHDQSSLIEQIKLLEQLKYPSPLYECRSFKLGEHQSVLYVKCSGPIDELSVNEVEHTNRHSLLIRKLSIIGGMMQFAGEEGYIDVSIKDKLIEIANAEIQAFKQNVQPGILGQLGNTIRNFFVPSPMWEGGKGIATFSRNLSRLARETNKNPAAINLGDPLPLLKRNYSKADNKAISQVRNAEKFFLGEMLAGQILINETPMGGDHKKRSYFQMNIPVDNVLTDAQKREYLRIHVKHDQPEWFKDLKLEQQNYFLKQVPKNFADSWESFRLFQTSAMQNIPGKKNIRTNYVYEQLGDPPAGNYNLVTRSIKSATPVPYEMGSEPEKQQQTVNNIFQELEVAKQYLHSSKWANIFARMKPENRPKPLVFFHSLLADNIIESVDDTALVKAQTEAMQVVQCIIADPEKKLRDAEEKIAEFMLNNPSSTIPGELSQARIKAAEVKKKYAYAHQQLPPEFKNLNIIYGNDSVNFYRWFMERNQNAPRAYYPLSQLGHEESWEHVDQVIAEADKFIAAIDEYNSHSGYGLNDEQRESLSLIENARLILLDLRNLPTTFNRNRSAFKSAYLSILVEAMDGIVLSNCKSGKDRTNFDEIYHLNMRNYFSDNEQPHLPDYDAKKESRNKFIKIFKTLFNTKMQQQAASFNSLGSDGLKNSSRVLCFDVQRSLRSAHDSSNERSNTNKPGDFPYSESLEKQLIRNQYKDAEKNKKSLSPKITTNGILRTLARSVGAKIDRHYTEYQAKQENSPGIPDIHRVVISEKKSELGLFKRTSETIQDFFLNKLKRLFQSSSAPVPDFSAHGGSRTLKQGEFAINYITTYADAPYKAKPYFVEQVNKDNIYQLTMHQLPDKINKAIILSDAFKLCHARKKFTKTEVKALKAACKKIKFVDFAIDISELSTEEINVIQSMKFRNPDSRKILDHPDIFQKLEEIYLAKCTIVDEHGRKPTTAYRDLVELEYKVFEKGKKTDEILILPDSPRDQIHQIARIDYCNEKKIPYELNGRSYNVSPALHSNIPLE